MDDHTACRPLSVLGEWQCKPFDISNTQVLLTLTSLLNVANHLPGELPNRGCHSPSVISPRWRALPMLASYAACRYDLSTALVYNVSNPLLNRYQIRPGLSEVAKAQMRPGRASFTSLDIGLSGENLNARALLPTLGL